MLCCRRWIFHGNPKIPWQRTQCDSNDTVMIVTFSGRVHRYSISPGNTFKLDYRSVAKGSKFASETIKTKELSVADLCEQLNSNTWRHSLFERLHRETLHNCCQDRPQRVFYSANNRLYFRNIQLFRLKESIHCIKSFLGMFHAEPLSRWYIMTTVCGLIPGGGESTLGISGWGCAAGTLEPLTYTRANSAECCYPILE